MKYSGARHLKKKSSGQITVNNPLGTLQEKPPVAYVKGNSGNKLGCQFTVQDQHTVGFDLEESVKRPVVIDPYLSVSTYIGGGDVDKVLDVEINNGGNGQVYIAGRTKSAASSFPYQSGKITGSQSQSEGFVAEYSDDGRTLNWITIYGGSAADRITGIDIRKGGLDWPYVVGDSESQSLPGSAGTVGSGGTNTSSTKKCLFAANFDKNGAPQSYAFIGSPDFPDKAGDIIYTNNDILFTGQSNGNFKNFNNQIPHQGSSDAVLVSWDDFYTSNFATFYGGSKDEKGKGIAQLPSGDILIGGWSNSDNMYQVSGQSNSLLDRFLVRFTTGGSFVNGTVFGGSSDDALFTSPEGLDVGPDGYIHVTGFTNSSDLTTTSNAYQSNLQGLWDMFYARFNGLNNLAYATYYGGSDYEEGLAVKALGRNHWILAGYSQSTDIPVSTNNGTIQSQLKGSRDPFFAEFKSGDLNSSTYYGGSDKGSYYSLALDKGTDYFFAAGRSASTDYYTTSSAPQGSNAGAKDGVLTRFSLKPTCTYPNQTTLQNKTYSSSKTLNGNYIINGYLEITSGTLTIKNASLLFQNCGVLRVTNGADLKIKDATLASCDQAWKGVRVKSNSNVDISNAQFRNAEVAVDAKNTNKLTIKKSTFKNNYQDISLRGYNNLNKAATINNNTFKKEKPLFSSCSSNPIYGLYHRPTVPKVINIQNSNQITPTKNVKMVDNDFFMDSFKHTLLQIFRSKKITMRNTVQPVSGGLPPLRGEDYIYAKNARNLTFKNLGYDVNYSVPVTFRFIESRAITVNRCILDNNRPKVGTGILFKGCRNITVKNNSGFSSYKTGIAYYPYRFSSSQSTKISTIKFSTLDECKFGIVAAPERNPYQAPSSANTSTNKINLDIKCNKFDSGNRVGIFGSGNLKDQGSSSTPAGNNFDDQTGTSQNTEWDILWQYRSSGPGFEYYYYGSGYQPNSSTSALNYASYWMNGVQHPCGSGTCPPPPFDPGFDYGNPLPPSKGCYGTWKKSPTNTISDKPENKAKALKVFPNPFREQVQITFNQPTKGTAKVTNVHGQRIAQTTIQGKGQTLETGDWKPGTYFIQIIPENGQVRTRKIIKME